MIYIISQIIGILAFTISLISFHRKKKKDIFKNLLLAHILNIIHYFLLGATSGCITKVLALLRDYFIILKEKYPKLSNNIYLLIFILLYVLATILTYNGIISILPAIAAIIYIIFVWNGNEIQVKKAACYCYILWLIYNIFVLSIAGIVSNSISIISTLIAVINEKKGKKHG